MRMLRVLAVLCVFVIASNYLGIRGVEGQNIPFSLTGATATTYSTFLTTLRNRLKVGTTLSHDIPVLRATVANVADRFILVDLINYGGQRITVAIDVINVYVLGYLVGNRSYFLRQLDTTVPIQNLFPGSTRTNLSFTGGYTDLERPPSLGREKIPLGPGPLNSAIISMQTSQSTQSFIIIIQMVSEAARYQYIEQEIRRTMAAGANNYTPGYLTLSIENQWSALSKGIQQANAAGTINPPVQIRDHSNNIALIETVARARSITGIALLLNQRVATSTGGSNALVGEVEPSVSFIKGYNDLCMQANSDNSRVWLDKCVLGRQQQRWALYSDGTIRVNSDRSLCLTPNGHSSMDVIIILTCRGLDKQRWVFKSDGSILNPNAKLVMDVKESNVSLHQIILYQPTGQPNQQWLPSF